MLGEKLVGEMGAIIDSNEAILTTFAFLSPPDAGSIFGDDRRGGAPIEMMVQARADDLALGMGAKLRRDRAVKGAGRRIYGYLRH